MFMKLGTDVKSETRRMKPRSRGNRPSWLICEVKICVLGGDALGSIQMSSVFQIP